jgi:hypothetical protein
VYEEKRRKMEFALLSALGTNKNPIARIVIGLLNKRWRTSKMEGYGHFSSFLLLSENGKWVHS